MGITAYLECYRSASFDPGNGGTQLFASKGLLPPAWFLFFDDRDFASLRSTKDGSMYTILRREPASGIGRARERLAALDAHLTRDLERVLRSFVDAVAAACSPSGLRRLLGRPRALVLNSHRFESTRAQLKVCVQWFDAVAKSGVTPRLEARAQQVFDPCDGLDVDVDKLELGDPNALCGWPSLELGWQPPEDKPQHPEIDQATADAILARVWAAPGDLATRLACARELMALGDVRGEFITLDCKEDPTERDERRRDKLLESECARLGQPFTNVYTFHHGLPIEVTWDARPGDPLIDHPAWSTVETVRFSGPVALLPRVRHLHAKPELVRAIDRPVPFVSICLSSEQDPAAWQALESIERLPDLVEVYVASPSTVWLPEAAQRLLECRPSLHVRSDLPLVPATSVAPMSAADHAARIHCWSHPPAARFMAGPRYDNGFA